METRKTIVAAGDAEEEVHRLRHALEQSVRLQSHYAGLLNVYDGGKRLQFATAEEWLARLSQLGATPGNSA